MKRKKYVRAAAWVVLFAALFAQAAIAATACLKSAALMQQSLAASSGSDHCHDNTTNTNTNLCLYHWADQSDQTAPQPPIAAATSPVLVVARTYQPPCPLQSLSDVRQPGHGPPIPIRFCSFLI